MLRIGFFQNFKSADTVLIDGTPADIQFLSMALNEVPAGKVIPVHEIAAVSTRYPVELFAASTSPGKRVLWWNCSNEEIDNIQGKLEALTQDGKGHQYFYLEGSDVQLMVSVGEYGELWWQERG